MALRKWKQNGSHKKNTDSRTLLQLRKRQCVLRTPQIFWRFSVEQTNFSNLASVVRGTFHVISAQTDVYSISMLKSYTDFFRVIYNAVAEFEVVFHAAVSSAENSSVLCRAVALSFSFLHSFCLCNCLSGPAYCYYSLFCSFSFSLVCYNFYHIYCIIL